MREQFPVCLSLLSCNHRNSCLTCGPCLDSIVDVGRHRDCPKNLLQPPPCRSAKSRTFNVLGNATRAGRQLTTQGSSYNDQTRWPVMTIILCPWSVSNKCRARTTATGYQSDIGGATGHPQISRTFTSTNSFVILFHHKRYCNNQDRHMFHSYSSFDRKIGGISR